MSKKLTLLLCLLMLFFTGVSAQDTKALHVVSVPVNEFGTRKYGFADESGKVKIDYIYDYVEEFSEGYALVMRNRKAYFIDKNGLVAFNSKTSTHKYISGFRDGRALVEVDGKYGFVNTKGQLVIPAVYEDAFNFSEGKAAVCKDGKYGYINTDGDVVIDFLYDGAASFNNNIARINKKGRYGFIDENGDRLTAVIYERTGSFNDRLCPVRIYNKYSFVNKFGLFLTPLHFDWASDFQDGVALVKLGDNFGLLNTNGDTVISISYSTLGRAVDGYIVCAKYTKYGSEIYGVIGEKEEVLIPFKYESVEYLSDNLFLVCEDGRYGVTTYKNKFVIPVKYDSITKDGNTLIAVLDGVETKFNIDDIKPVNVYRK